MTTVEPGPDRKAEPGVVSTPDADANGSAPDTRKTAHIYRVAARIFSERGFHATSINEIAEAVDLTKAGLYYYIQGQAGSALRDHGPTPWITIEERVIASAATRNLRSGVERIQAIVLVARRDGHRARSRARRSTILVNELQRTGADRERPDRRSTARQRTYRRVHPLEALRGDSSGSQRRQPASRDQPFVRRLWRSWA